MIVELLEPHVAEVLVANTRRLPQISRAKAKTDRLDARTLAKLAYQQKSSLPKTELGKIIDKAHLAVLEEAEACIQQRLKCYRTAYGKK